MLGKFAFELHNIYSLNHFITSLQGSGGMWQNALRLDVVGFQIITKQ
jgi:hypothetical protein